MYSLRWREILLIAVYKVIHIAPTSVEVEDVLYNNRQSIPLTQGPQG